MVFAPVTRPLTSICRGVVGLPLTAGGCAVRSQPHFSADTSTTLQPCDSWWRRRAFMVIYSIRLRACGSADAVGVPLAPPRRCRINPAGSTNLPQHHKRDIVSLRKTAKCQVQGFRDKRMKGFARWVHGNTSFLSGVHKVAAGRVTISMRDLMRSIDRYKP